jgi:type II secretory pathway pseudopilin PulG
MTTVTCALRRRLPLLRRVLTEEAGITLTELLVTMSILAIVVTTLTGVFVSGSNAQIDLNNRFHAQSEARAALAQFRRDVHRSCARTVAGGGTSVVLTTMPYDPPSATSYGTCSIALATWCTTGTAPNYTLRRASGSAACGVSSTRYSGYLTTGAVFTDVPGAANSGLLPRVAIDLPVDTDTKDTRQSYRLTDSIALRNATRS